MTPTEYFIGDTINLRGVECEVLAIHPEIGLFVRAPRLLEFKLAPRMKIQTDRFWYVLPGKPILGDLERGVGGGRQIIGVSCGDE